MQSTQTVHGQVSSPMHVYIPLAVMEEDVPGSRVSDEARKPNKKKRMILFIQWKAHELGLNITLLKNKVGKYIITFLIKGSSTDLRELRGKSHVFSLKYLVLHLICKKTKRTMEKKPFSPWLLTKNLYTGHVSSQTSYLCHDQHACWTSLGRKVQSLKALKTINKTWHYQKMTMLILLVIHSSFLLPQGLKSPSNFYTLNNFVVPL